MNRITIIGLGLIGGSLASAFRRKKIPAHLTGVDLDHVIDAALQRNLIDEGYSMESLEKAIEKAGLVILAVPISAILELLPRVAKMARPETLITDMGSTKEAVVRLAAESLPKDVYFVGGHPMAGAEKKGLENADPFLFENVVYVLTRQGFIPDALLESFVDLIESIGARVMFLSPQSHDRIAAAVSHLPQILAVTLMNYVSRQNDKDHVYLKLAAGGFRDMTRVASSPFDMWKDICATNANHIRVAIDEFIGALQTIRDLISAEELELKFLEAAQNRLAIPSDTRGFLRPHFDASVVVEDKPGQIAAISAILARKHINIKDIEILKVREGDAGTLRLAFESEAERKDGLQLLREYGFEAKARD